MTDYKLTTTLFTGHCCLLWLTDDGFVMQRLPGRPGSSRYHVLPMIGQTLHTNDRLEDDDDDDTHLHTVSDGCVAQHTVNKASVLRGTDDKPSVRCHSSREKHVELTTGQLTRGSSFAENKTAIVNKLQSSTLSSSVVDQVTSCKLYLFRVCQTVVLCWALITYSSLVKIELNLCVSVRLSIILEVVQINAIDAENMTSTLLCKFYIFSRQGSETRCITCLSATNCCEVIITQK